MAAHGLTLLLIFCVCTATAQSGHAPPHALPGHCYAKCITPKREAPEDVKLPVYTDKGGSNLPIDTFFRLGGHWLRSAFDSGKEPETTGFRILDTEDAWNADTLVFITDTSKLPATEWVSATIEKFQWLDGTPEWVDVLCGRQSMDKDISRIQNVLVQLGYSIPAVEQNQLGRVTKARLVEFQRRHGLAVGGLGVDVVTLLGID